MTSQASKVVSIAAENRAGADAAVAVRFVTASSLFDGHDASINIMRRILQGAGAEVIHLGHNRSVAEIVAAAIQEDVQGIAISSYQGGHVEYFKYMVDMLRERGAEHIQVFGGGGGVIVADEIDDLHNYGVARIYTPEDGQNIGLQGMIDDMLSHCRFNPGEMASHDLAKLADDSYRQLSPLLTAIESGCYPNDLIDKLRSTDASAVPVLGITGTGGSGKSSLTDELIRRFRIDYRDQLKVAILAVDPTRRKTGGALLGDRIRMNAIDHPNIFMRSIATRDAGGDVPPELDDMIAATRLAGFDLIIIETPGIGQGDAGIVSHSDVSLYVMTPEFGAASQLEKIDMLDFADVVAINKFDRKGAEDALRDVAKQVQRNRESFTTAPEDMPVYGTMAARFNDDGVSALYSEITRQLSAKGLQPSGGGLQVSDIRHSTDKSVIVPSQRIRYLAEIAETVRNYHADTEAQATIAREKQRLQSAQQLMADNSVIVDKDGLSKLIDERGQALDSDNAGLLTQWPALAERYKQDTFEVEIRDRKIVTALIHETLSGNTIRKVSVPAFSDDGDLLKWLRSENLPGYFPYTAGVFPFKREGEDPTRMFAGEGDPYRTNSRFKALSEHAPAKRLSTAFDSVTLYGNDPDRRPDIYGKVGNSGVSIATVEDMQVLYDGFDLCDPNTSVSMTINGPESELDEIKKWSLANVRGTVQADILKEDQGQNTCIFSTEFSLKVMGDIQEYFVEHDVRNFYSVSISGYHIAEAGANPISQLAFTLANGFTYVESYLARGMHIDEFAANLSFFFSNGMDPEYTVMGRVARRIWAVAMREKYGANDRSQKLKYHIQTSGRSLHAQEMAFNDIRTTLQALIAVYDNCNSLHTNAYDEAVTTPTEESVRRAIAIQLIINREWGLAKCENPNQGSFVIDELTDLVEEAVLIEFERISERGGVLGAMETGYQRGKIQEESMLYEHRKHDGSLPIVGVNTFTNPSDNAEEQMIELARSTTEEKESQIARLEAFKKNNADEAVAAIDRLKAVAMANGNVFAELVEAVQHCSLGQITDALFEVGGEYRRNM